MSNETSEDLTKITDEQQASAIAVLAQQELSHMMIDLTQLQRRWLRWRALSDTDVEARHRAGKQRGKDNLGNQSRRFCGCSARQPGWIDLREATVVAWKHQRNFLMVYNAMLYEPLIFAATSLEQTAGAAVDRLHAIIVDKEGKVSDQRLAAVAILESTGLKQTAGTIGPPVSAVQNTMSFRIARERVERGLQLSVEQAQLMKDAGVDVKQLAAPEERTLDGEVIERGGDNSGLVPD